MRVQGFEMLVPVFEGPQRVTDHFACGTVAARSKGPIFRSCGVIVRAGVDAGTGLPKRG